MIFHGLNLLFGIAFLAMAAVQLNDPDPALWIGIYSLAAVCCLLAALRKLPPAVPLVFGLLATVGAAAVAVRVGIQPFPEIPWFEDEELRELGGLVLVILHMGALYTDAVERRTSGQQPPEEGATVAQ